MKKLLLLSIVFISFSTYSQKWQQLLSSGERDFNKIQNAFYEEWDGKIVKRGNGYKQFKRWEYNNAPRLLDGKISNPASLYTLANAERLRMSQLRSAEMSNWESIGPYSWQNGANGYNPGIGRVNSINIHPTNPEILFVGTAGGGLWKSETGGNSWNTLSENFPVLGVTDFYIASDNTEKMYVLTGDAYGADTYSQGVFKSTDGGITWANNSNFNPTATDFSRMYRMIVDPNDSDVVLIAGAVGIWKSTDGAESWGLVSSESFVDIEFKPGNSDVVYASTYGTTDFGLSEDGGETWSTITTSLENLGRTAIGVSVDNPEYVYLVASSANSRFGGVYKSTDSGKTFAMQSDSPNIFGYSLTAEDDRGQGNYDLSIAVNPEDAEDIYVSGIHIWNSKDGGQSWQDSNGNYQVLNHWVYDENNVENYVHADNHTLDFLNEELFAGSDGGIWKSSDLGDSWMDLSQGLNNTQLYRLGLDPNDANVIIAGAQDNGSNILINDTWTHIFGADGMEALIDHTDGSIVYSTYQFGGLLKYSDRGAGAVEGIAGDLDGTGDWITPFMLDPQNSNFLYAGYQNVWRYDNDNASWEEISSFGSSSNITSLKIAPTNSNYIYSSTGFSTYRSVDGGSTWGSITSGLPSEYLSYIAVSEDDAQKIWATFSGFSDQNKVYESEDGGSSWSNISEGLPNIPINCIVHQQLSNDQLYVGTDIGIYQKNNDGNWEPWFDAFPNVRVNELEIHYGSQKIVAATYGRGLWSADVISASNITEISSTQTEVVEGESVSFSASFNDGSSNYSWTFEGGSPETSTDPEPVITYPESGQYNVSLNGATKTNMISVLDLVTISTITMDNQTINAGKSVIFTATYDGNPSEWLWTFEEGTPASSKNENPIVTYNFTGEHDVTLWLKGETEDTKTVKNAVRVLDPLSTNDPNMRLVYPTISDGAISLKIDHSQTNVTLMTISGEIVKELVVDEDISLNLSDLASGVYLLKIKTPDDLKTMRVIRN